MHVLNQDLINFISTPSYFNQGLLFDILCKALYLIIPEFLTALPKFK